MNLSRRAGILPAFAAAIALILAANMSALRAEPKPPAKPTSAVTTQVASWEEAQKIVAKHKGKIVVLDLWSTWCQPCVKEFPHLVQLQKAHPEDVVAISFNCNYIGDGKPEDEAPDILKFLNSKQAAIINLISSDADEALYKKVGIASIPVVQVYGRDGKLAKQFDNEKDEYGKDGFNYEKHIIPYVQKLAAEK